MAKRVGTVRSVRALRKRVAAWQSAGETVALVPTMGALHEGHLSLVRLAKKRADRAIVSIFVNPAQFAPSEDLATYPRDEVGDRKKLAALDADLIFAPTEKEMYPPDFSTRVQVADVSEDLCGASRPQFFAGVATVVAKLLIQCLPDLAVFGDKDYQQLLVVRRLARDLDIPVKIIGGPIVREPDGLAMSSRNAYLSAKERQIAPLLHGTIKDVASDLAAGRPIDEALTAGRERLIAAAFDLDYLEVRDANSLKPVEGDIEGPARVFVGAYLGRTRLIDNVAVPRTRK
ncbi:MAG: pantoate--beta-alanine ligase [Methyloligellaceae bacterium]